MANCIFFMFWLTMLGLGWFKGGLCWSLLLSGERVFWFWWSKNFDWHKFCCWLSDTDVLMGFLFVFSAVAGVEGTVILHSEKKASSHYHNYSSIYTGVPIHRYIRHSYKYGKSSFSAISFSVKIKWSLKIFIIISIFFFYCNFLTKSIILGNILSHKKIPNRNWEVGRFLI